MLRIHVWRHNTWFSRDVWCTGWQIDILGRRRQTVRNIFISVHINHLSSGAWPRFDSQCGQMGSAPPDSLSPTITLTIIGGVISWREGICETQLPIGVGELFRKLVGAVQVFPSYWVDREARRLGEGKGTRIISWVGKASKTERGERTYLDHVCGTWKYKLENTMSVEPENTSWRIPHDGVIVFSPMVSPQPHSTIFLLYNPTK